MTEQVAPVTQVVTPPAVEPAPQVVVEAAPEPQEVWEDGKPFDAAKAKALIEKLRNENKDLKPKAKKADDLEAAEKVRKEAEMTELQKAQQKIADLEAQTKAADLRELRRKVGEAAKLPADIYELLPEMDEDAMKAKAEQIAKALPKPQPGLSATNPGANKEVTPEQRRAFLYGNGPKPN